VAQVAAELYPGATLLSVERLGEGEIATDEVVGMGEPLLIRLELLDGQPVELLFQTKEGHSPALRRRADRAAALLAAYEGFARVPRHARALDVGVLGHDGVLSSLRDSGEFYLVTELVPGFVYAEQLRAIAERGELLQVGSGLCIVTDLADAWLTIYVPEPDLGRIRIGQAADVRTDGGETRQGKVTFIASQAEFTPKTVETPELRTRLVYQVRVHVCNPQDELRLGMPATVSIPLDQPKPEPGHANDCAAPGDG